MPHLRQYLGVASNEEKQVIITASRRGTATMRWVATVVIVAVSFVTSAHAGSYWAEKRDAFFNGLACRKAQVLGGQNDIGAILYHDPVDERPKDRGVWGNPVYTLSQAIQPLGIFRILPATAKNSGKSRIRTMFGANAGILTIFDYVKRSDETKFYWSPSDDLVVWNLDELWWADGRTIRSGFPFLFERIDAPELKSRMSYDRVDVVPEHFERSARWVIWSVLHHVVEFEPRTPGLRDFRRDLGPITMFGADQLGWTQSDVLVRLTKTNSTYPTHLEILDSDNKLGSGLLFSPLTFPYNARLLLVRDNKEFKIPEALLLWRDEQSVGHIGMVRLGGSKPTIVAKDYIKNVFLYPDRTKAYGYSDHAGRFHPLLSEKHGSGVVFWLEQLKAMDSVEEFSLLDDAKYAVIKRSGGATGPEAIILERRGSSAATLDQLCRTNSPVERVLEGPSSLLFVPKEPTGNGLVVYLHDGPFSSIGRSGDWIIDILVRTGSPVLAVNYFGSSNRIRELAVTKEIAPLFAKDIEQAVAFAKDTFAGEQRPVIFVAQGFGALVGLSSMMAEAVWPERFLILSGLIAPGRVFSDHVPNRDPFELNYLARTGHQMRSIINPAVAARENTRFLFLHGDADDKAPYTEAAQFVTKVNAPARQPPAKLSLIQGMSHSPETKREYEAIAEAIEAFIGQP